MSRSDHPGAHVQIHAHRDGITYVMSRPGRGTRRARRRADDAAVPSMHELHFPVGGARFRPCLEDVLEMLVSELGVDCSHAGREALRHSRERWRRLQLRAAVHDAPADAAAALEAMGYSVTAPTDGHRADNPARLREH